MLKPKDVSAETFTIELELDALIQQGVILFESIELDSSDLILSILPLQNHYVIESAKNGLGVYDISGNLLKRIYKNPIDENGNVYTLFFNKWIKGDTIFLFDDTKQEICLYDNSGKELPKIKLKNKDSRINYIGIYKDGYIGHKAYMYGTKEHSQFVLLDKEFQYIKDIRKEPKIEKNERNVELTCSATSDEVLVVQNPSYKIFSINTQNEYLKPKYAIDFGKYQINLDKKNINEILRLWGNGKEDFVVTITNIYESDDFLYFNYGYSDQINFAIYDKKRKISKSYFLKNTLKNQLHRIFLYQDKIIFSVKSDNKLFAISQNFNDLL